MNATLFKREVKCNIVIWLIFCGVLAMYTSVIISMFDPQLGAALDEFAEMMPEMMAAFGMSKMGSTLIDSISSYLYGMLMLILPMVFEIMVANRLIARYVDKGSMAYLLSTPHSRKKIAITQAVFLVMALGALLIFVTLFGLLCCQLMFPGDLDISKYIALNIGTFMLHICISGFCFLVSCLSNDTKTSYSICAGVPVGFYLIQMMANMGGKLENLKYFTIYTLFSPSNIITGQGNVVFPLAILCVIGIICYVTGIMLFSKRDLFL